MHVVAEPRPAAARARAPFARSTVAALGATVAGAALTLAFPPYDVWPVAVLAVGALTALLRVRSARAGALIGFGFGLGFFVPLLHWSGVYVGPVPWLILATFEAAYVAGFGALAATAMRLRWWPLWVAALWVAQEAVRGRWPFGGFPWGRLAFSQADSPVAALAAVGGAPLVSFAVALAGTLAVLAVLSLPGAPRRGALAAAGAAVSLGAGMIVPAATPTGATASVGIVQGNVPRAGLDFNAERRAVLGNHVNVTKDLAGRVAAGEALAPDLVIWPENSSDIDPYRDAEAAALIDGAVRAIGVPVLVGAIVGVEDGLRIENTAIVWDPAAGPGETYVKRHPVPFAEYIPFRRIARMVSDKVDLVARDQRAGTKVGVFDVGPVRVGDVICFEVAYDGLVGDVVRAGAQLISVQTNNATFGYTPETEQQLAMSRLRAREHGRSVVVAATSGVSALVAPDGRVVERAELFTAKAMVHPVVLADTPSLASRIGVLPEALLAVMGLLAAGLAAMGRPRRAGPR